MPRVKKGVEKAGSDGGKKEKAAQGAKESKGIKATGKEGADGGLPGGSSAGKEKKETKKQKTDREWGEDDWLPGEEEEEEPGEEEEDVFNYCTSGPKRHKHTLKEEERQGVVNHCTNRASPAGNARQDRLESKVRDAGKEKKVEKDAEDEWLPSSSPPASSPRQVPTPGPL